MIILTTDHIKASVESAWNKLNTAIQRDLDAVLAGDANLTASNAASVLKFIQLSADLSKTIPYLNYHRSPSERPFPVFDDEPVTFE
jgi:hypothetical protein